MPIRFRFPASGVSPALFASLFFALLFAAGAMADEASDVRFKYSMGFDYSRGDYGIDRDTEIFFVPISVEANYDSFRAKLTLPFVSIDGPTGIAIDSNGGESGVDPKSYGGLGQVSGRVGYFVAPFHAAAPWFEFTGKMSAPTESEDALGSGKWAFSLQTDAFKRVGRITPFARLGRTFYTGSRLDDRLYTSIGSSFVLTEFVSTGIAYDWFEATTSDVVDTHDLVGFASIKVGKLWSFGPYALAGLSNGSPDYGVGFSFVYRPSGA